MIVNVCLFSPPRRWRLVAKTCRWLLHIKFTVLKPRAIFGPTRTDDCYWRIKTNQEINDILKGQNITEFIKKAKIKLVRPC